MVRTYIYLGDKLTDLVLKKQVCEAVVVNQKCVRGKNGNMLVFFPHVNKRVNVLGRLLRKL